mmetsp:Transcript_22804/g.37934  ORF Transcript_22804/g.37934 Transcript_22804/m.37934 type:complete len:230 (-) Transcript_22804:3464-4153(-)
MAEFEFAEEELDQTASETGGEYWSSERMDAVATDLIGLTAAGVEFAVGIAAGPAGFPLVFDSALGGSAELANLAGHMTQDSDDIHDAIPNTSLFSGAGLSAFAVTGVVTGDTDTAFDVSTVVDAADNLVSPVGLAKSGGNIMQVAAVAINSELTISGLTDDLSANPDTDGEWDWDTSLDGANFGNVSATGSDELDGSILWDGIDGDDYIEPNDGGYDVEDPGFGDIQHA